MIALNTPHGVEISGTWTFQTGDDFLQILTRSDGTPAGGFGETNQGIEFRAFGHNETVAIGGRNATVTSTSGSVPNDINAGDSFDFLIRDNGNDLFFQLTRVGVPADTVTVTGTSSFTSTSNLITFHNRESGRISLIDNLSITVPEPSRSILLLLGCSGLLLIRRRR